MNEQPPPPTPSLTDRAVQRLRKLASGNAMEPVSVAVIEAQESIFTLTGTMEVSPTCESLTTTYPGAVRSRDRKLVPSIADLQTVVEQQKTEFQSSPDWLAAITAEIKTHDSQGWGLENAKIILPQKSIVFAATEMCPSCNGRQLLTCTQCQGRGTVTCNQCQGQGREHCYYCGGTGDNPQQPGQRCTTCNGTRFAPCRFCQTRGYLTCPTCSGRRGTPCTTCQGKGKITQEISLMHGGETHFRLDHAPDLPSGLRRGLERLGMLNLSKGGHADIVAGPIIEKDGEPPMPAKPPFPILTYKLTIPYAELRMSFGAKKAIVSVVGKRCAIMGVPPFLDIALKKHRDLLHEAARGKAAIEAACEARAIKDIVALGVSGKGRLEEVRKIYPYGLSTDAVNEMLADMRLALNLVTLHTRTVIAIICGCLCAGLFYTLFTTGRLETALLGASPFADASASLAVLALALGVSWTALNFSTRFVLQKRFPKLVVALQQKIGKTGLSMLAGIVAVYALCIALAPLKPVWLAMLLQ